MAFLVADAELARLALGPEAVLVGLHDIDGGTLRSLTSALRVPTAIIIVELDKVDTSGAFTANTADIDVKLQGATEVLVPVSPVGAVVQSVVKDKGTIIQPHLNHIVLSPEVFAIEASHEELPNAPIAAVSNETLHLSRCRLVFIFFLVFFLFFLPVVLLFFLILIWIRSRLRLGLRFWGSIVRGIFCVTPLVDLEVRDLVDGVDTACGRCRAHVRALFDGGVSGICVIPG